MKKAHSCLTSILVIFLFSSGVAFAAPVYYEGKTIRSIVGYSAGGGFDAYARLLARHMKNYIPGKPAIIVENMTGAGSLIAANHMGRAAKPDGLTMGQFNGGLFFGQLLEQPGIQFDARKFIYVGAIGQEKCVIVATKKSGITSMEKLMTSKTPVKMGGTGPGNYASDNIVRILKATLGVPIQLVSGYKGTADLRLAIESGELDGSSWSWASMSSTWRKPLKSGDVVVILQCVPEPIPDLPNVPLSINYAKTAEARQLIEVGIHSPILFARPLVLPPNTPKELAQIIIKAFNDTLKDKEFLAEAEKTQLEVEPVTASDLEKSVNTIFELAPAMRVKLKGILYD
ncbi:MAG: tripartite tricarboxylate transporter substrate-binding protein [Deltaproteobacteria bacterium]